MQFALPVLIAAMALSAWSAKRELDLAWPNAAAAAAIGGACLAALGAALGSGAERAAFAGAALVLLAGIAETDRRRFIIPDALAAGLFGVAMLAPFGGDWQDKVIGAAVCGGLLLAVRQLHAMTRGAHGLGLGDVKLAAALGALLGMAPALFAIAIGCGAMAAFALVQRTGAAAAQRVVPLGVGLAAAGGLTLIAQLAAPS